MEDESLLNKNPQEAQDYLNELAIAVCINGDRLEKYEKLVTVKFGEEVYANTKSFVDELQRSIERKKFTNTSKVNLSYLGKNAGLSEQTIEKIVEYHAQSIDLLPDPKPSTTLADSLKTAFSKLQVKLAEEKGIQCHVSEGTMKKLIGHSSQPNHALTVFDKYPDAKFIRDTKRWLIPKWFWWTLPIQLAGMFFSLGGLLIILWAFYHFRRKAVKNLFIEETRDKFVRISDLYKLGIYNRRTMRIILPIEYDSIDKTDSGVYLIKKGVGQGLFWKKKKTVPAEYDKISEIKPGVFVVEKAGLVGVINNGKVFIPAQYDRIAEIESGIYVVEKAGMVGAVNDGKEFIPTQYDRIEIKKDGLYSAIKGSDIKYYTKDGAILEI